ncbi:hypothetical protein OOJ96_19655 [Pseudomonas sp. 15FMM2]|uniref:Uncharacterized protein n=1 Tax=Pseudomonas imrae TaxID=2992837 RepID=A0ACC7PH20_9PSED
MNAKDNQDLHTRQVPPADTGAAAPKDPRADADPVAKDNEFSPDFKPEREPKPETDADIDTQGG